MNSLGKCCLICLRWAECWCFSSLSIRLNVLLHGMSPFYFHITNLLLHCAVTCLLMYTCECCVFEDAHLAFVTALIFAVHPIHTEAVSNTHTHKILFAFYLAFIRLQFSFKAL